MTKSAKCLHCIENTDGDNQYHQDNEELVHCLVVHLSVQSAPRNATADSACYHQRQGHRREVRHAGNQCSKQTCQLTEQDDIQADDRCGFAVHTEAVSQHHQIDGTAADAQETGDDAKQHAHRHAEHFCTELSGGDFTFGDRIQQGSHRDQGQDCRLNAAHHGTVGKECIDHSEQLLACHTTQSGTQGKGGTDCQIHFSVTVQHRFPHRVEAH